MLKMASSCVLGRPASCDVPGGYASSPGSLRPCWKTILNILTENERKEMEITKQEVEKVAKLARLAVTEGETRRFRKQLSQILTLCAEAQEVYHGGRGADGDGVGPESMCFAPDQVQAVVVGRSKRLAMPRSGGAVFPGAEDHSRILSGVRSIKRVYVSTNVASKDSSCDGDRGLSGV